MKETIKKILGTTVAVTAGIIIYEKIKETKKFKQLVVGHHVEENVPTLMLHGVKGDRRTMQGMIHRWNRQDLAYKALQIEVSETGEMFVNGTWNKESKQLHPIIQVFFDNNDAPAEQQAEWLTKIMVFLHNKLDITEINLIGHSMGGVASLHYLTMSNEQRDNKPEVTKFITLGSPFKGRIVQTFFSEIYGLEKDGERNFDDNYNFFMAHKNRIPSNLHVLNIYGELEDDTMSDGIVAVENALALGDIVQSEVETYEEVKILGLGGQHTLLHENSEVDEIIADFLWD